MAEQIVDSLNEKLAFRNCIAFISEDLRVDKTYAVSLIHSFDKYDVMRMQEISGGSYYFSTDALIAKLKIFEKKYPFRFVGVGKDWLTIKTLQTPKEWTDFALEVMKVCPTEENNIENMGKGLQKENGEVFMWWD